MGWEETTHNVYKCPCGTGEIEEIGLENDWMQHETRRQIHCPECKDRYTYDSSTIAGSPGHEIERGWVLNSVLKAEKDYKEKALKAVRAVCSDTWRKSFDGIRTRKGIWEVSTADGRFGSSLQTFYKHTKGYDNSRLMQYVNRVFNYFHDIEQITTVTGITPNWSSFGIATGPTCELCGSHMIRGGGDYGWREVWICQHCGYRRPTLPVVDVV